MKLKLLILIFDFIDICFKIINMNDDFFLKIIKFYDTHSERKKIGFQ